jgi:hypothetical protein
MLSKAFYNLYSKIEKSNYNSIEKTDELAIKKYNIEIKFIILTLYKKYGEKFVLENFCSKIIDFFNKN